LTDDEREARRTAITAELLAAQHQDGVDAENDPDFFERPQEDSLTDASLLLTPLDAVGIGVVIEALFSDGQLDGDDRRFADDGLRAMEHANGALSPENRLYPEDLPDFLEDPELRRGVVGHSDDPRVRESFDEDDGTWEGRGQKDRGDSTERIRRAVERAREHAEREARERSAYDRAAFERELADRDAAREAEPSHFI
jgi:hypothetical protein